MELGDLPFFFFLISILIFGLGLGLGFFLQLPKPTTAFFPSWLLLAMVELTLVRSQDPVVLDLPTTAPGNATDTTPLMPPAPMAVGRGLLQRPAPFVCSNSGSLRGAQPWGQWVWVPDMLFFGWFGGQPWKCPHRGEGPAGKRSLEHLGLVSPLDSRH